MKKADSLVCISEALKLEAISRGISKNKITVSPNGYDAELQSGRNESEMYKSVKSYLNIGKSTKVIGYIGSLRKLEGVDYTAKAVAKLCDLVPSTLIESVRSGLSIDSGTEIWAAK